MLNGFDDDTSNSMQLLAAELMIAVDDESFRDN